MTMTCPAAAAGRVMEDLPLPSSLLPFSSIFSHPNSGDRRDRRNGDPLSILTEGGTRKFVEGVRDEIAQERHAYRYMLIAKTMKKPSTPVARER